MKIDKLFKSLFYKAYCPVCHGYWNSWGQGGYSFPVLKELDVIGAGPRKHLCQNCTSTDRLRIQWVYLHNNPNLFKGKKILHIAPEKHLLNLFKSNASEYVPSDINDPREEVRFMDITNIDEFEENYFDLIICNHVLEHIENDTKAMAELFRVLKLGGKIITQIPYSNKIQKSKEVETLTDEDREREYGQYDHVRIYSFNDFVNRMCNVGFVSLVQNPFKVKNIFLSKSKLGLNYNEALFLFTKK